MKAILFLLVFTSFYSCSKIEELENRTESMDNSTKEMKDITKEMSDTTKEMNETTNDMQGTTEVMRENTEELLMLSRQGATSDLREKAKNVFLNKDRGMGDVLTAAKKYFYAFEYQVWNGRGEDTLEEREALLLNAMEEFYRLLNDLNKGYTAATPIEIESAGTANKAFYALATTMHFNNDKQASRVGKYEGVEEISMYDIIKSSLEKFNAGEQLHEYEQVVVLGENYRITENLLNARLNFVTALGIKDMVTGQQGMTYGQLLQAGALKKWYLRPFRRYGAIRVNSTFELQNVYTQEDIKMKLDGAVQTKNILAGSNFNTKLDKYLHSIIKNLSTPNLSDDGRQNEENLEVYNLLDTILE